MNEITKANARTLAQADIVANFVRGIDASAATKEAYKRAIKQYMNYLTANNLQPFNATRETVLAYKEQLNAQKSAATVNAYLTAVRAFYTWAETCLIYPNIAAGIKGARMNPRSPKTSLTATQAHTLLDTKPTGENLQALRDYALINLMVRRGLRTIEVARADIGDLKQVNGEAVLYLQGKGYANKSDFVKLNESCLQPIYAYLEVRGETDPDAPLFASIGNRNVGGRMSTRTISRIVKNELKRHGMESAKLTAHSLRHTAVTFALLGGASLQETQQMARHANINTTLIYAHNLDRMQNGAEDKVDAFLAV